jgi:antitoxin VapB
MYSLYRISLYQNAYAAFIGEGRLEEAFYQACAMGMNIKDPKVHAMAKELAARRGTSVTDAVRQALNAELERLPDPLSEASVEARKDAIRDICRRTSALPEWQGLNSKELQDALYDENGLPA